MALSDEELERYARHIVLKEIGGPGQARLRQARVLVIGAGGLGAPLLMYLAAAGVGTLGVVDDDEVSLSNLQRQIVHDTASVGLAKTASAAASLARINPGVSVVEHPYRITAENAMDLITAYDIVADGSDNFATRYLVIRRVLPRPPNPGVGGGGPVRRTDFDLQAASRGARRTALSVLSLSQSRGAASRIAAGLRGSGGDRCADRGDGVDAGDRGDQGAAGNRARALPAGC